MAYIALGANLSGPAGEPADALRAGLAALDRVGLSVAAVSRFWRSPAFPAGSGPDFVNACATLRCDVPPEVLLDKLHEVEAGLGRQRDGRRWVPRALDLDLLGWGDAVRPDAQTFARWHDLPPEQRGVEAPGQLILPHPRLHERAFVLIPLAEIAPGWCHPVLGRSVAELAAALPKAEIAAITPI